MSEHLRIKATDAEDISVMSACLQDMAVNETDIVWEPTKRRFGIVGQRYRWEAKDGTRINSRVWVDGVTTAQRRKTDAAAGTLDLLAVLLEGTSLIVHFAGGEAARLTLSPTWRMYLEDFGPAWPAEKCPEHTGGHGENA